MNRRRKRYLRSLAVALVAAGIAWTLAPGCAAWQPGAIPVADCAFEGAVAMLACTASTSDFGRCTAAAVAAGLACARRTGQPTPTLAAIANATPAARAARAAKSMPPPNE
jgi:hypothetical protein